jgi:hypothetical protein
MKPYSASWHRIKGGLHSGEDQSGECGEFMTIHEATRFVDQSHKERDGKGHPDYTGVWWEVIKTDEDGNGWTVYSTPRCT